MDARVIRSAAIAVLALGSFLATTGQVPAQETDAYARRSGGTRSLELASGTTIRMLLDSENLGGDEVEVAEIVFPAGLSPRAGHAHGSTEIFYVVEGALGHVVNGREHRLEPGMVGVVKPGDEVIHRVLGDEPVRALVIWVPGGEAERIAPRERWTKIER